MIRNRFLLPALLLGLIAPAVPAQDRSSHLRIDDWTASGNDSARAAQEMDRRLRSALGKAAPAPNIEPELLQRLLEAYKNDPEKLKQMAEDPRIRRRLQDLQADNPELQRQFKERFGGSGRTDPMNQERIQKLVDEIKQSTTGMSRPGIQGPGVTPPVGSPPSTPITPPSGQPNRPMTPPAPVSGPTPPVQLPTPEDEMRAARFREFVRRMDRWMPQGMKDSEALKRFTRRLGDIDWSKATGSKIIPDNFRPKLNLDKTMQGTGRVLERTLGRLDGRMPRMPRMPRFSAPNLPGAPSLPSMGAPGAPSAAGAGGAFTVLMILGAIVVGAFLIWKLLVQPMRARTDTPKGWQLGAWPVEPARVRTRDELIKAFDYLALLNGGKPARHWHHREVADHLGTNDQVRRVTAERLAQVYVQARYTPPQEPLPETQIDLARNDLCTLAGVGAP